MAFVAAHTLTSAALAGQATSCIGAEPVSLLLALISYSIGIGHEYKVQNMAYVEWLTLGPRQSRVRCFIYGGVLCASFSTERLTKILG